MKSVSELDGCYRLKARVPPNSSVEILTPRWRGWQVGPVGGEWVTRVEPAWWDWCPYKRKPTHCPASFTSGGKTASVAPRRLYRQDPTMLVYWGWTPASITVRNQPLFFRSPQSVVFWHSSLNGLRQRALTINTVRSSAVGDSPGQLAQLLACWWLGTMADPLFPQGSHSVVDSLGLEEQGELGVVPTCKEDLPALKISRWSWGLSALLHRKWLVSQFSASLSWSLSHIHPQGLAFCFFTAPWNDT